MRPAFLNLATASCQSMRTFEGTRLCLRYQLLENYSIATVIDAVFIPEYFDASHSVDGAARTWALHPYLSIVLRNATRFTTNLVFHDTSLKTGGTQIGFVKTVIAG